MFRWLNRSDVGSDRDLAKAVQRINLSIQEFLPGFSKQSDYEVVGYCEGCGSLIWGNPKLGPKVLSHCDRCDEDS